MIKNYHQGDVILEPIKEIPKDAKFLRKNIIMYGEITGHAHTIEDAEIYEKNGILYCRVIIENPMVHEEHPSTEIIPTGDMRVRIQKEYFPTGERQVKD